MKEGDMVYVNRTLGTSPDKPAAAAIIIKRFGTMINTHGRAWYVMFEDGKVLCKLAKDLEVINESR